MFDTMIDMMAVPAWYKDWVLTNGGLGLILGAGYLLASIFLLLLRPGAPTLFMVIAGLSICRGVLAVVGLLIDVVLIIVVAVSDRSAYGKLAKSPV